MHRICRRQWPTVPGVLFAALVCFVAGCGRSQISSPDSGVLVCSAVGCEDQFAATVTVDVRTVPAGTHTLAVTADGTDMSCTFPFPPANLPPGQAIPTQCTSGLRLDVLRARVCTTTQSQTVSSSQCQPVDG